MRGCLVIRVGLISSTSCVVIELCVFLAPLGSCLQPLRWLLVLSNLGPAGRQILTAHLPRLHARAVICIPSSGQLWTPSARTNLQWGKKETDSQTQVRFLGSANSITGLLIPPALWPGGCPIRRVTGSCTEGCSILGAAVCSPVPAGTDNLRAYAAADYHVPKCGTAHSPS